MMRLIKNTTIHAESRPPVCNGPQEAQHQPFALAQSHSEIERAKSYVSEIMFTLIPIKSSHPLVREIHEELNQEFQSRLSFRYEPGHEALEVTARNRVLDQEQKNNIIKRLWQLTWAKINVMIHVHHGCFQD